MKKTVIKAVCFVLAALMLTALAGCGKESKAEIDYLVLVNKENKLPADWEEKLETVTVKNSLGDEVEVESRAYDAYLKLKSALEKEDVHVDLDSARRSVAEQQRIWDDFIAKYDETYTRRTVATPGYSEHHTGLALDLYLNVDGEDVYENEDMVEYPEIWEKIHNKLADYGFILRYLKGKEAITGYGYEPWHIRYLDDEKIAKEITDKGITLEEYLNRLPKGDVAPPEEEEEDPAEIYGENPVSVIATNYKSDKDGLTAEIRTLENGQIKLTVTKQESETVFTEWSMTGDFDSETLTFEFNDDVMKRVTLSADNIVLNEGLEYNNGSGKAVFKKNRLAFTWKDEQSGLGSVTFTAEEE